MRSNSIKGVEFEKRCLDFFAYQWFDLRRELVVSVGVSGYKKEHKFDLGSENSKVVIECKCHTWTSGNNTPSAKMSTWNEAMYYFHVCPSDYKKIFCVLKSEKKGQTLCEYYIRIHGHLIPDDVEIWEYDLATEKANLIFGIGVS